MNRFRELFKGYTKAHGLFTPGTTSAKGKVQKKTASTVNGAPTEDDWTRHLAGEAPGLGILPLMDDDESVMFGAIDIDVYGVDIADLERRCEALPLVFSKSKSGGAHVWLFCAEPLPATLVQAKLAEVAAYLGHGGCEIFPKQTTRANDRDVGNWINLPYYGDTRKGILMGKAIDLERFCDLAEKRRATLGQVLGISVSPQEDWFKDGPPCLQALHKAGWTEGSRNNGLFNVGVYFRLKTEEDWERNLLEYNSSHLSDPLPVREVQSLADNIRRKDYGYTCNQPPVVSFCNKSLCGKREFGIGGASAAELDVTVGGLTKYDSRPPLWVLEVNGARIQVDTDDLMQFGRFAKLCVENLNHLPAFVPPKVWTKTVQGWLSNVVVLPAPEDASPVGQFLALVKEFISDRARETPEDMATGNVWVDDGWAHFRSTDLVNFLKRQAFQIATQKMYALLNEYRDAEKGHLVLKGKQVEYWRIRLPAGAIQTEASDTKTFEGAF